jgi:glycosyltransferase involved in cell wall biosynthesis
MAKLPIIMPTLNEASTLMDGLARLQWLRSLGHEVIVVDGGSEEPTTSLAAPLVDRLLTASRGRALQMNAGAASAKGDPAIFVRSASFARVGVFPELPLMEDIALCRRPKRESEPVCLRARVVTSGRRFELRGVVRAIALMWRLRLAFWLGASPERLSRSYHPDVR